MPKIKKTEKIGEIEKALKTGMYKGYSLDLLRQESSHPDHHLVVEFDLLAREEGETENE